MSSPRNHSDGSQQYVPIDWNPNMECCAESLTCRGSEVTPMIRATTEKGFFAQGDEFITYRRNYFAVLVSFELHHPYLSGPLHVRHEGHDYQVMAFGMRLSAVVDQPNGKVIELVQHTPKRDNGPKTKVEIVKVCPTPAATFVAGVPSFSGVTAFDAPVAHCAPVLPFQHLQDTTGSSMTGIQANGLSQHYSRQPSAAAAYTSLPGQPTSHVFDRVQFKNATANNGKRRASQQYFLLKVELWADIRSAPHESAVWIKVAQKISKQLIVRGRSPSHYSAEGARRNSRNTGGPGAGAGAGAGVGRRAGPGAALGLGAGAGAGAGTDARGYPVYPGPNYRGSQAQFGYHVMADGALSNPGMYYAHTANNAYLSPTVPSSSGVPSLIGSPNDFMPSQFDLGLLELVGSHGDQSGIGGHSDFQQDARFTDTFAGWDDQKVSLVETGGRRDRHRDRSHRRSAGNPIAVTTPSPVTFSDYMGDGKTLYYAGLQ